MYVSVDELTAILGTGADAARALLAAQAVSDWIDAEVGQSWDDVGVVGGPAPLPPRVHQLALIGALRFYHDPEAPYGVIHGGQELPMYMKTLMVDAEPLLLGLHVDFGIA